MYEPTTTAEAIEMGIVNLLDQEQKYAKMLEIFFPRDLAKQIAHDNILKANSEIL